MHRDKAIYFSGQGIPQSPEVYGFIDAWVCKNCQEEISVPSNNRMLEIQMNCHTCGKDDWDHTVQAERIN